MLRTRNGGLSRCVVALAMLAGTVGVLRADDDERRPSAHASVTGEDWWQWALSIPAPYSPLLDSNLRDCMIGQRGDVWFLAGLINGGAVERRCQVPEGVALFFPVVNAVNFDTPGVCGQGDSVPVQDLRRLSRSFIEGVEHYRVTLDGHPVRSIQRLRSKVFTLALPADNIFDAPCAEAGGVPRGLYGPAVDDGLYVTIDHLSPGRHTLEIKAAGAPDTFTLDVTST